MRGTSAYIGSVRVELERHAPGRTPPPPLPAGVA